MKRLLDATINQETISYFIVGVITTAVDYISFTAVNEMLKNVVDKNVSIMSATVISWLCAVIFAFFANKTLVFRSKSFSKDQLVKEGVSFFSARITSGIISFALMWILTGPFLINEYLSKVFTSGFNLVFNYIAGKYFVFKK